MMREIRLCLLEADVNVQIVREFTNKVKEKALGEEVRKSIKPGDMFVKILKDELVDLLGGDASPLVTDKKPTITMIVGLQGGGKTTTIGKIGNMVRKKYHKKPMFIACDVYRPAAIDQLKDIGKSLGIEVYEEGKGNPVEIVKNGINYAKEKGYDYILIDTAGRLQIDEKLMDELVCIENEIKPNETLLVIDAMMGQDVGDMWYHTTNKELRCYRKTTTTINDIVFTEYGWALIEDSTAIAAYEAASNAQDTADGKRRVFVNTPYPPYDIGD